MASPTLVLVHGAWHGAWCWSDLQRALDTLGVASIAVDLPGHGDDRRPLADLRGDAARVGEVLDSLDTTAVLVGHSYGGVVITAAGVHDRVTQLVYVAALNPDDGESAVNTAAAEGAGIDHGGRPSLGAAMHSTDGGATTTIVPSAAYELFYNTSPADRAAAAVRRLGPQRMGNFTQSPQAVAWRTKRSHYVICEHDNAVHPDLQRILARRATTSSSLAADHSPFLSAIDELAALLASTVAGG